ncbi:hypothetical protein [Rhizobium ruizarguesonis]|uniref:hypothetical protein n=1 Tax=Rhizobium ruizarguesonis TaxID=2081791 RepID=UPI0010304DF5|nr:hypothetical protein [Rhizobium ruizarguesonis]TAV14726.1 hypothetical protein ELI34_04250 [Rhizobium ruizarguesonis]
MKPYIALLSTILVSTPIAHADSNLTVQGLLDNVCVSGRLDEERLSTDVQSVAKAMDMRVQAIPADHHQSGCYERLGNG